MNKIVTLCLTLTAANLMPAAHQLILLGTYTPKDSTSRGIYAVQLDTVTGELSQPVLAAETPNPTFLALSPNGRVVYTLGDSAAVNGESGGAAVAFNLDRTTGKLSPLNAQPTGGGSLAHLGLDATGKTLVTISYNGGQITSFPIEADGKIDPRQSSFTSAGPLGPQSARQDKPHPHSVTYSPDNHFAYVCDLGRDKIICYRLDAATATLTPSAEYATAPGDGPRHSKFSADGRFFYVINELAGSVAVYRCDSQTGSLTHRQSISTLPAHFTGQNTTAEIRIHPNGRFVYGSNRGHDSLAVYSRNQEDGTLKLIEIVPSGGGHPRNFNLTPDGAWLICANRDSDNLVVYKVDAITGRLTATGHTATVPRAVCVLFVPSH